MSGFKVVNKRYNFSTRGEIEFLDLTDKVQEALSDSGIRNGVVHVFVPHATGILILAENDYALRNNIKAFLEKKTSEARRISAPVQCSCACVRCFYRQTRPFQRLMVSGVWNVAILALCVNWRLFAETNCCYTGHWRMIKPPPSFKTFRQKRFYLTTRSSRQHFFELRISYQ